LEFDVPEGAPVRRLDAQGLLRAESQPTPVVGRRLRLEDALFAEDVLIFDRLQSESLTYGAEHGPRLRVSFTDTPLLGLWTKPRAGFICIEPWHGIADPAGFTGDFHAKPGVFTVAPGAQKTIVMTVSLLPDAS
jgi:galactose mutarotase-like enzyme